MRKTFSFWRSCFKSAAHGNSPFANDWQWASGNPALQYAAASATPCAGTAAAIASKVGGGDNMTAVLTGILAAAAAFAITWLVSFVPKLLRVPADRYYEEKDRADDLQKQFAPRLKVSFDMNDRGCVRRDVPGIVRKIVNGSLLDVPTAVDYFRLKVETTGLFVVRSVACRLASVNGQSIGENLQLPYSETEKIEHTMAKDIISGTEEFVDFIAISKHNELRIAVSGLVMPGSISRDELFPSPGKYHLSVVFYSPELVPVRATLTLKWTGDRKTTELLWGDG
jgi:hypothetical protein